MKSFTFNSLHTYICSSPNEPTLVDEFPFQLGRRISWLIQKHTKRRIWWDRELSSLRLVSPICLWAEGNSTHNVYNVRCYYSDKNTIYFRLLPSQIDSKSFSWRESFKATSVRLATMVPLCSRETEPQEFVMTGWESVEEKHWPLDHQEVWEEQHHCEAGLSLPRCKSPWRRISARTFCRDAIICFPK